MPLGDVSFVNAALDAVVASWPATGAKYRLFVSDPSGLVTPLSVELGAGGGYAGVTFAPGGWASASAGSKSTSSAISFGTSTAAYADVATYWGIVVTTSGLLVFSDDLNTPIAVDAAGVVVSFTPTLTFADGG